MGYKIKAQFNSFCKKINTHSWNVGAEIFYDKEKKIVCIDEQCYLSQGGSTIESKQFGKKSRNTEERIADCQKFIAFLAEIHLKPTSSDLARVFSF